ncbi:MAG TPA: glycerophosphodiester phosphodiesterase [Gemmatimonadaceae bacterium]|nr:glycerophosphodiester phosphodiesterase [Gemmatimonadaceae bacterium]
MNRPQPVEHIAHRGAKRELAENTVPAFLRAVDRGADAIELDVHATSDGVVVVHHDPDVPVAVGPRPIAELAWNELAHAGTEVPRLLDVLEVVPDDVALYVELKGHAVEDLVAALLGASKRCAVHSFDHSAVARMGQVAPALPRGILFDHYPADVEASMRYAGARDVWPEWRLIDQRLVSTVHAAGGRVIAWTVNARSAAERLAALGVDGLCTDDVRLLEGL